MSVCAREKLGNSSWMIRVLQTLLIMITIAMSNADATVLAIVHLFQALRSAHAQCDQ